MRNPRLHLSSLSASGAFLLVGTRASEPRRGEAKRAILQAFAAPPLSLTASA